MSGRLMVEIIKDEKTESGLFLPQSRKDGRTIKAKVIAEGQSYTSKSGKIWYSPAKAGSIVYLNKIKTQKMKLDDRDIAFPAFEDVLACA